MPVNTAFSQTIPYLQTSWDSTSIGALKQCAQYYKYVIIDGWSSAGVNRHLHFGIIYHAALETYDREKARGRSHVESLREATRRALKDSWDYVLKRPWTSGDSYKNRFTLIRTVVWYLTTFENDSITTLILENGKPAVELSFRFRTTLVSPDGEPYSICGHLDRIGSLEGYNWVVDRKTTTYSLDSKWFGYFSPDNQMSLYSLAAKVVYNEPVRGVIIDGAQILVGGTRYNRAPIPRSEGLLDEWYYELGFWIKQAETFALAGVWPKNDKSCGMYGGCPFRAVCSAAPAVRGTLLNASFIQRPSWNPLEIRGDI